MKKLLFPLAIVLLMVSCDNPTMTPPVNPFIGTWEEPFAGGRLVFTANEVTMFYSDGAIFWKGTYTFNDTHLIITLLYHSFLEDITEPWNRWYEFPREGTLTFAGFDLIRVSP